MARFPQDQFDDLPEDLDRVGAHRAPPRRGRGWIAVGWAVLASAALVAAGLYGLSRLLPDFSIDLPDFSEPTDAPVVDPLPTAEPVTDPATVDPALGLSISILNGSPTTGQQNVAGDALEAAGWPETVRARAATDDVATTTIFYQSSAFEGVARGIAQQLGVGDVVLSDAYLGAPVTVLLGADYAPSEG